MNRHELILALQAYETSFSEERLFIPRFLNLLTHSQAYLRDHLPGHMTGSAWIVDSSFEWVALTHHAKLNRWLQPGGHADGDEDIAAVGLREAQEETGISTFRFLSAGLFDIDIHPIPERNGFPLHDHYDVRVLLQCDRSQPFVITEESHDLQWVHVGDLAARTGNNQSMLRMAEKVRLFAAQQ